MRAEGEAIPQWSEIAEPVLRIVEGVAPLPRNDERLSESYHMRPRRQAEGKKMTERLEAAGDQPIPEAARPRPRILVVEDNPVSLELMVELLSPRGFEVYACSDGREVMRLAKAHRPDLILLDINLLNIDGLTLARMLREDSETRAMTILAVSAYVMPGEEERMLKAGCDGFIAKPIDTKTVLSTVSTFLQRRRSPEADRDEAGRTSPES